LAPVGLEDALRYLDVLRQELGRPIRVARLDRGEDCLVLRHGLLEVPAQLERSWAVGHHLAHEQAVDLVQLPVA
jgi:hypothetical protein